MDATGKELVAFWSWAADKGVMNPNTAAGMRAACAQVLSALDDWETKDIRGLDIEDALMRFQNLKRQAFKPAVLETYKRRFRQGVTSFLSYIDEPAKWSPTVRERALGAKREGNGGAPRGIVRDQLAARQPTRDVVVAGLTEYPFPLREGVFARLQLPPDLKASEARRLATFVNSLAIDSDSG